MRVTRVLTDLLCHEHFAGELEEVRRLGHRETVYAVGVTEHGDGEIRAGIGEGSAGGVRMTLLYAARLEIQLVEEAEVAAAAASVVDVPAAAGIVVRCWP